MNISSTISLDWETVPSTTSYDVYFGQDSQNLLYLGNTSGSSYSSATLSNLTLGQTYYWKVVARNGSSTATGVVWSFTTQPPPPPLPAPAIPAPGDKAVNVGVDMDLDWADVPGALSYDVYFGDNANPSRISTTSGSSYALSSLIPGKTYYWKIVALNGNGSTASPIWSFTTVPPPPPPPLITLIGTETRVPYVVRFAMRLRDGAKHAIGDGVMREMFVIEENGRVVDYRETTQFVTPGSSLPLRLVLVLDYTGSMQSRGAIDDMVLAATNLINSPFFTASHEIGVVEFHKRTDFKADGTGGYSILAGLTKADDAGKKKLVGALLQEGQRDHRETRVWDAVALATELLKAAPRQQGEAQAILFMTDGRDTTSLTSPANVQAAAKNANIALYPIAFGEVQQLDADTMQGMANETNGKFFSSADPAKLNDFFQQVVTDLRGQWTLTYITQKNEGTVNVRVAFTWQGQTAVFTPPSFDASKIKGDPDRGILEVFERQYDAGANVTRFGLRAAYIPLNIAKFRFVIPATGATLQLQATGGLTNGWTLTAPVPGVFDLAGNAVLEPGSFGNIGAVIVPGNVPKLKIASDDTIYKNLPEPKKMGFEGAYWQP